MSEDLRTISAQIRDEFKDQFEACFNCLNARGFRRELGQRILQTEITYDEAVSIYGNYIGKCALDLEQYPPEEYNYSYSCGISNMKYRGTGGFVKKTGLKPVSGCC